MVRRPQTEKRCPKCGLTKPCEAFALRWPDRSTLQSYCKECSSSTAVQWARDNKRQHNANVGRWRHANPEKVSDQQRQRREQNLETERARDRARAPKYRERKAQQRKKWLALPEVRDARREYERNHRRTNPHARIAHRLRARLREALRGARKEGTSAALLGCSIAELAAHLESKFLPGMTWDSWGNNGWHIDHVRPLKSFDLTDPAQLAQACHYTNLQPLFAAANRAKGARYEEGADIC